LLAKLKAAGVWPVMSARPASNRQPPLKDRIFVVTGTLAGFSREGIKNISSSTAARSLTASARRPATWWSVKRCSKLDKARELGITSLTSRAAKLWKVEWKILISSRTGQIRRHKHPWIFSAR
jgi:NAD-dependent DNA ligase